MSTHCPHLSRPQAEVLALCSYGMTLAHACAITTITVPLAPLFGQAESTLLQRLREWYYSAADKRGGTREVEVPTCFAPRLALDARLVGL